ncbi:hypothetical protein HO173_008439 [Letharia columbiana]|uniref:Uncharacterized protein n=1 Tax=Letharia columbiana TaxID=112416 RepID=A0A8H6FRB9_9LECA|nr:uncharacterized protein HO173_008439 [Letharia columbiana]KAF6233315.1 hypothetical protein HO173_008439 [Letharia columbiana]
MLLDLLQETTLDEQTCDTEIALRQQVSKMEEIRPGILTDAMLSSLHKVIAIVSDLCPQFEDFSLVFYMEKDIMNHAFGAYVEAYAITITRSNYMDLSPSSLLIFPTWSHTIRFINQYVLIPFLPEPRLYSLQVKSEIRFQMKQLIDESTVALNRINISSEV